MQFPRQQAEVVGLVDNIINGVTEHSAIFPHCNTAVLQTARNEYEAANNALTEAESQMALAAERKLEKFKRLQQEMKKQIKLGVVDTVDNPVQLGLIGWGTKRRPQPIEIPGSPTNLKITAQGTDGTLCLVWRKPRDGGPVRSFIIERKQFGIQKAEDEAGRRRMADPPNVSLYETNHGGLRNASWSEWQLAGSSYNNEVKLLKQPIGIKLEYQIRASNTAGVSLPSNTVGVVL
jgi:hypothetical protein